MTIRAILQNGRIQPLDPIPSGWSDGQKLVVEEPDTEATQAQIDEWARDLEVAVSLIPVDEHERFQRALDDIERESKASVRREWGLP